MAIPALLPLKDKFMMHYSGFYCLLKHHQIEFRVARIQNKYTGHPSHKVEKSQPSLCPSAVVSKWNDKSEQLLDRKSTRLNSSHSGQSRMPSSA